MTRCFFVSDLHGRRQRYEALLLAVARERPAAVFLGGDLLPPAAGGPGTPSQDDFVLSFLAPRFAAARLEAGGRTRVFLILGNDDCACEERSVLEGAAAGAWEYVHGRRRSFAGHDVYGYSCVPPTPFRLKDWERYDVSRYVDPGCCAPEEGWHTVDPAGPVTIAQELERLTSGRDLSSAVVLFHSPPYHTGLDRAALDGRTVDHAPVDVHVGSIAIRRFLEGGQPLLGLHGHVHESPRLTGRWRERIGRTWCFSAAHDGPELALLRFDLEDLENAERELLPTSDGS